MSKPDLAASPIRSVWLASQSPRRAQLLTQVGIVHRVLLPADAQAAEALETVRSGESPKAYVRRVARAKLEASVAQMAGRDEDLPILCADTTVAFGGHILGKPLDADDATRMLRLLSGKTHRVITALAVARGVARWDACSESRVRFAPLSPAQIRDYVDSGEPFGKAGAYAVQGRAAAFIAHISGSYSGIMGLPLYETMALLEAAWMPPPRRSEP